MLLYRIVFVFLHMQQSNVGYSVRRNLNIGLVVIKLNLSTSPARVEMCAYERKRARMRRTDPTAQFTISV